MLGPKSPRLQHLRRLSGRRRARREHGQFVVDGPTLVRDALEAGAEVLEVYAEPTADPATIAAARAAGVAVVDVAADVLARVTSPVTPRGVAALVALPPAADVTLHGIVLVLAELNDPGNVGTLLRAAEAAGVTAVVSCGDGVDPWNPKCVRASAGSVLRVPIVEVDSVSAALDRLRASAMTVLALDAAGESIDTVDLRGDVALVLGNEAHGVEPEVTGRADRTVAIPMAGRVESLNVAMAGTVVAFEAARQRRVVATGEWDRSN